MDGSDTMIDLAIETTKCKKAMERKTDESSLCLTEYQVCYSTAIYIASQAV